jgi:hypothetical protein
MMNNLIKVDSCKIAIQKAFLSTYLRHNEGKCSNDRVLLLELEHLFQIDHQCEVLKLYSIKNTLPLIKLDNNRSVGINYWHQLQFDLPEDVTMFLLKWS